MGARWRRRARGSVSARSSPCACPRRWPAATMATSIWRVEVSSAQASGRYSVNQDHPTQRTTQKRQNAVSLAEALSASTAHVVIALNTAYELHVPEVRLAQPAR